MRLTASKSYLGSIGSSDKYNKSSRPITCRCSFSSSSCVFLRAFAFFIASSQSSSWPIKDSSFVSFSCSVSLIDSSSKPFLFAMAFLSESHPLIKLGLISTICLTICLYRSCSSADKDIFAYVFTKNRYFLMCCYISIFMKMKR